MSEAEKIMELKDAILRISSARKTFKSMGIDPKSATPEDLVLVLWEMNMQSMVEKAGKAN